MFSKAFVLSQISVIVKAKLGSPIFLLKSNSEFTFYFPQEIAIFHALWFSWEHLFPEPSQKPDFFSFMQCWQCISIYSRSVIVSKGTEMQIYGQKTCCSVATFSIFSSWLSSKAFYLAFEYIYIFFLNISPFFFFVWNKNTNVLPENVFENYGYFISIKICHL